MSQDALSQTFSALADPTRRAILAQLATGATTVGELAEPFEVSLPAISKHLKVLENAGLIVRGRDAQWRPCTLAAEPLRDVDAWLDTYRKFWDGSFDRLERYLAKLQASDRKGSRHVQPGLRPGKKRTGKSAKRTQSRAKRR